MRGELGLPVTANFSLSVACLSWKRWAGHGQTRL